MHPPITADGLRRANLSSRWPLFYTYIHIARKLIMKYLPPQGTPPPNTAADMAHSTYSSQPALRGI